MTKHIDTQTLRDWLEHQRPVTVLDVRSDEDRAQWATASTMADAAAWLPGWLESESAFVNRVTSNLPPTPPNFSRIVDLNEAGDLPSGDLTDLEAGANRCAVR
jgi:hypothetical protein